MLKQFSYRVVAFIAEIHDKTLSVNKHLGLNFTDKQLHFIMMGLAGLIIFLVAKPIIKFMVKHGLTGVLSWIGAFTFIVAISFAIEAGQYFTGTGRFDMADIASGIVGFLALSVIYGVILLIIKIIKKYR